MKHVDVVFRRRRRKHVKGGVRSCCNMMCMLYVQNKTTLIQFILRNSMVTLLLSGRKFSLWIILVGFIEARVAKFFIQIRREYDLGVDGRVVVGLQDVIIMVHQRIRTFQFHVPPFPLDTKVPNCEVHWLRWWLGQNYPWNKEVWLEDSVEVKREHNGCSCMNEVKWRELHIAHILTPSHENTLRAREGMDGKWKKAFVSRPKCLPPCSIEDDPRYPRWFI
jgi:hypothetical protein